MSKPQGQEGIGAQETLSVSRYILGSLPFAQQLCETLALLQFAINHGLVQLLWVSRGGTRQKWPGLQTAGTSTP